MLPGAQSPLEEHVETYAACMRLCRLELCRKDLKLVSFTCLLGHTSPFLPPSSSHSTSGSGRDEWSHREGERVHPTPNLGFCRLVRALTEKLSEWVLGLRFRTSWSVEFLSPPGSWTLVGQAGEGLPWPHSPPSHPPFGFIVVPSAAVLSQDRGSEATCWPWGEVFRTSPSGLEPLESCWAGS